MIHASERILIRRSDFVCNSAPLSSAFLARPLALPICSDAMSLKTELGRRLLIDMIKEARGSDPAIVLVVDPHTSKILSSALSVCWLQLQLCAA